MLIKICDLSQCNINNKIIKVFLKKPVTGKFKNIILNTCWNQICDCERLPIQTYRMLSLHRSKVIFLNSCIFKSEIIKIYELSTKLNKYPKEIKK